MNVINFKNELTKLVFNNKIETSLRIKAGNTVNKINEDETKELEKLYFEQEDKKTGNFNPFR
jgi:hypothetical protein